MITFKKIERKPTFVDMAEVSFKELSQLLKSGIDGKKISISDEDLEYLNNDIDSDKLAGFIAADEDNYWFVNLEFAQKNYKI